MAQETALGALVDTDDMPWTRLPDGADYKLLWTSEETGAWTMLVSAPAGTTNGRHRHLGPADFFVIKGRIDYVGGSAGPGAWLYEPAGAVHDKTSHPEDTVYLANVRGPLEILGPKDEVVAVVDGFRFRRDIERAQAAVKA